MTPSQRQQDGTVDVPWVAAHAGDPTIRVVEVDVSRAAYDQGHIPGATHWDAYVDLRDAAYRPVQPLELQQLFSRSGITPETTIVFYGYAAQLGFWLAKAHGHRDVRMLIGPREQWTAGGQRWTAEPPKIEESVYPLPIVDADILASRDAVESAIDRPGQLIVDVRSQAEYSGERFWPSGATAGAGRSGHIPGAINVPIDALRGEDGTPKSPEELATHLRGRRRHEGQVGDHLLHDRQPGERGVVRAEVPAGLSGGPRLLRIVGRVGQAPRYRHRRLNQLSPESHPLSRPPHGPREVPSADSP